MPVSEIDDIFSGKSKPTMYSNETTSKKRKAPEEGQPSSSKTTLDASKKKKDAAQNPPNEKAEGSPITSTQKESKKARVVETVLDTSSKLTGKLVNVDGTNEEAKAKRSKNKTKSLVNNDKDDLKRFQDSRGSGPRLRTEEGFLIYKEEELGITSSGGDTPLCPFDCECCF